MQNAGFYPQNKKGGKALKLGKVWVLVVFISNIHLYIKVNQILGVFHIVFYFYNPHALTPFLTFPSHPFCHYRVCQCRAPCKCSHNNTGLTVARSASFYSGYLFWDPSVLLSVHWSFMVFLSTFLLHNSKPHFSFMFSPPHLYGKYAKSSLTSYPLPACSSRISYIVWTILATKMMAIDKTEKGSWPHGKYLQKKSIALTLWRTTNTICFIFAWLLVLHKNSKHC